MAATNILLGYGVIEAYISGVWTGIGLTRGGSAFVVEREFRDIEADGDRGPIEGRVVIDREIARLTINHLEAFDSTMLAKYYPGLSLATGVGEDTTTGNLTIAAGDYYDYRWTGYRQDGKSLVINLSNCLNRANIEWGLEDKTEVIPVYELTAHYAADARTTPPWSVVYQTGASYTVTFTVTASATPVENASVNFYGQTKLTNASGVAAFTNTPVGDNREFTVVKGGYVTYFGAVTVDGAEAVAVALTAI
jgi:hypothetical protein